MNNYSIIIKHVVTLLIMTTLSACATQAELVSNKSTINKRVEKPSVEVVELRSVEPDMDDSSFNDLMQVAGLPSYDPAVTCDEALKDLRKKYVEILSVGKNSVVAQSQNMNFQMKYEFKSSNCSERL